MLDQKALDTLFVEAHTHNGWLDKPVSDDLLRRLWDLVKMAPTSANCLPARIVFVRSAEAKALLKPTLAAGNVDKTMAAPVTAIIAQDTAFFDHLSTNTPAAAPNSTAGIVNAIITADTHPLIVWPAD